MALGPNALRALAEPTPSVQATPAPTASPAPRTTAIPPGNAPGGLGGVRGRIKAAMMEARQKEEASAGGASARLARMTPEERETFERNLHVWREMPPDERQDLRKQAKERNREEIEDALRNSGLRLDNDQKEVFALRYLQERRKLEREIQQQANAERTRRLPQLLEGLKREFSEAKPAASPAPTPSVNVVQPPKTGPTP